MNLGPAWLAGLSLAGALALPIRGADNPPPRVALTLTNGTERLELPTLPALDSYDILTTPDLGNLFTPDTNGLVVGYTWTAPVAGSQAFHQLRLNPVASNVVFAVTVLNRVAYGPTPDELARVVTGPGAIGPDAYLAEQLAPENIPDSLDDPPGPPEWQYVSVTGIASSSTLYIYLTSAGETHLDDLQLVSGEVPGQGSNLVKNGDFELPLDGTWNISSNHFGTELTTSIRHGGANALHLVASSGGTTQGSSVWQALVPALTVGKPYSLSYWYLSSTNGSGLRVRLSAVNNVSHPVDVNHPLVPSAQAVGLLYGRLAAGVDGGMSISDLRAWHVLHAVRSPRQLANVMLQFWQNHFTTQWSKTRDFISGLVTNQVTPALVATDFDFRELTHWRDVLLNPNGTFLDLLRISAESPAMVVYLDTVSSSGGNANENYSRELLELFTMGVDNGYLQTDIEQMARAWTGWRVDKLPPGSEHNPFAAPVADRDNSPGYWNLRFRPERHDTGAKVIFAGHTVDARFGPPYAGRSYQLNLPARPGTAGMQDGYDILTHLADLPYTREYICVKLCRLLVHENFRHGAYDYTAANASAEARLIKACIDAWDVPGPDGRTGNLRRVLSTIFSSELFRGNAAAAQKVKTPLEFVVSAIRSLRAARPTGGFTADSDGYDMLTSLTRLNFNLFNRIEPDGWSEFGRDWVSTSALVERMRFAQNFLIDPRDPLKTVDFGTTGKDNVSDPVGLLKLKLPAEKWQDAAAVTDFFLALFFPAEGRANLIFDRAAAISFLDSGDTGSPDSSPLATLAPNSVAYDNRVRSLVAFLLGLPRFQEQ